MARQKLQEGPYVDPQIAAGASGYLNASAVTTIEMVWDAKTLSPIFAYDPAPGKIYVVEAGGLITTASTGALTITPTISTTTAAGTALGASIAQTVPATSLSGPWYLRMVLVVRTVGLSGGNNATIIGEGIFQSGGVAATANSGLDLTFGGTSAVFDQTANQFITIAKTLSVAGSFTTHWAYLYSPN